MVAGSSVIANALIRRKESIGARCHQHCSGRVVEAALRCDLEAPLTAQQTAARRRELDAGPQLAFLRASAMPVTRSCSKPQRRRGLRRTFAHFLAKANISLLGCSSAGTTGLLTYPYTLGSCGAHAFSRFLSQAAAADGRIASLQLTVTRTADYIYPIPSPLHS